MAAMLATSAIAQDNTNTLPAIPAPASSPATETTPTAAPEAAPVDTNAPAVVKPRRHHIIHRHKISEPTITLTPGSAEVAAGNVNVRGQAGLKGEVIAHLSRGDTVNVLEQINLAKHTPDEPAQWVKISYPANGSVWVSAKYIDSSDTVTTPKLNLRAGPGENYSVVGVLQHGDTVTQIETRGRWMKIEPPSNAFAFVAAMYLSQVAAPPQTTPMDAHPGARNHSRRHRTHQSGGSGADA
jgi:stage II sporulation protein P